MKRRKRTWIRHGNTLVLLELWKESEVSEWQPVGYIMLRKIYPKLPATWQVRATEVVNDVIGSCESIKRAKLLLEQHLDGRRGYLQLITEPGPV